jgi:hypothetical protein
MSADVFASLTASLLVRKGDATPSAILATDSPPVHMLDMPVTANDRVRAPNGAGASRRLFSRRSRESLNKPAHTEIPRGLTVTLPAASAETIGFIAVKKGITRSQLSRLAVEGCGDVIILPVAVSRNNDRSVSLSLSDAKENFAYDPGAQGWVGDGGSFFTGGPDLFRDETGWCLTISLEEDRNPSVEICHDRQREAVRLHGFPAAMFASTLPGSGAQKSALSASGIATSP